MHEKYIKTQLPTQEGSKMAQDVGPRCRFLQPSLHAWFLRRFRDWMHSRKSRGWMRCVPSTSNKSKAALISSISSCGDPRFDNKEDNDEDEWYDLARVQTQYCYTTVTPSCIRPGRSYFFHDQLPELVLCAAMRAPQIKMIDCFCFLNFCRWGLHLPKCLKARTAVHSGISRNNGSKHLLPERLKLVCFDDRVLSTQAMARW